MNKEFEVDLGENSFGRWIRLDLGWIDGGDYGTDIHHIYSVTNAKQAYYLALKLAAAAEEIQTLAQELIEK